MFRLVSAFLSALMMLASTRAFIRGGVTTRAYATSRGKAKMIPSHEYSSAFQFIPYLFLFGFLTLYILYFFAHNAHFIITFFVRIRLEFFPRQHWTWASMTTLWRPCQVKPRSCPITRVKLSWWRTLQPYEARLPQTLQQCRTLVR